MKKLFVAVLALAMLFSLAACGASAEKPAEAAPAAEAAPSAEAAPAADTVATVSGGKLIMATNAAFPPYEFISDEDGETIVGIDAEIAGLIAEKLGLELQIEDMEFGSIITAVQTGKVDVGLAGMTVTEERLQNVNFSTSYAKGVQSIIVMEGSEIQSPDGLAGHTIGVQESTTGHIYCEDDFGAEYVTAYSIGANAVQALIAGKVDCVVIDNEPAKAFVEANEGLVILDTAYAEEDYAIAVSKDNEALLDAINAALEEMIADGTVKAVLDKYIGTGSEEPAAEEAVPEVATVSGGKLIMATNAAFPPYEFISDDDGETIVGIDAEIAGLIADKLGLELQIEDMEFGSIITAVQTGKVDVGLAGMTVTEERLQNVSFSTSYAKGVQSIIVKEGSEIQGPDDLPGHMIGVQESTTGHIYCEDDFGAEYVTAYSIGANAVQALIAGKVDCVVIDNEPAKAFVEANEGLVILDTAYAEEDYAIAVSKDNEALLDAINAILEELIADGTVKEVLGKYIAA